jgi:L-iduronidase
MEPPLLEEPREVGVRDGEATLELEMPLPSVSLLLLVPPSVPAPGPVQNLRVERYAGLRGEGEALLTWDGDGSPALRGYEVLRAPDGGGQFERLNEADLLGSAYMLAAGDLPGRFQVRAVDCRGRAGPATEPLAVK